MDSVQEKVVPSQAVFLVGAAEEAALIAGVPDGQIVELDLDWALVSFFGQGFRIAKPLIKMWADRDLALLRAKTIDEINAPVPSHIVGE